MKQENLTTLVRAAQESAQAADDLVRQYLPFIQSETAKFLRRPVGEGEDELSIALFAFHQAVTGYRESRGAFLPYAAKVIRSRLIDFLRRERRHQGMVSLEGGPEETAPLDRLADPRDPAGDLVERTAARQEIGAFAGELSDFGLTLADIAENCPRQERTLRACHRALAYAKDNPRLLEELLKTKQLPLAQLAAGAGVERKTLERHRRYLVAILLAYTNGFTIIRGHLAQVSPLPKEV